MKKIIGKFRSEVIIGILALSVGASVTLFKDTISGTYNHFIYGEKNEQRIIVIEAEQSDQNSKIGILQDDIKLRPQHKEVEERFKKVLTVERFDTFEKAVYQMLSNRLSDNMREKNNDTILKIEQQIRLIPKELIVENELKINRTNIDKL
ncbi:MAG: hypothetical protein QNK20_16780 [Aureibaculum sp.]|nr:hypothetical protein [Aureibaculum sp.]